jgi:hypothetical protein
MEKPATIWSELIGAIAYRDAAHLPLVLAGIAATAALIWYLKGRLWAFIYVALIPALNWTFGKAHLIQIDLPFLGLLPNGEPAFFQPLTIVTGLVFVVRDFVQREMGHRVLVLMGLAIAWSFYYSWPVIALASAIAFAISESTDWAVYTFTKYRLSTRILLSSMIAAPVDTTVFLYGADLAQVMAGIAPPGSQLNLPNWIFFIIGKLIGALAVSMIIRQREKKGTVDPAAA